MVCVGPVSRLIVGHGQKFNVAIFLDIINVKLRMMVLLTEFYVVIPLSVTLTIFHFQGHRSIKQFYLRILCSYLIKLQLHRIVKYVK